MDAVRPKNRQAMGRRTKRRLGRLTLRSVPPSPAARLRQEASAGEVARWVASDADYAFQIW